MVAMPSVNAAACVACILPTADACVVVGADIDVQQTSQHANKQTNEHTDMFASYCCIIWQLHHDSNISDNANVRAALIWRPMQCKIKMPPRPLNLNTGTGGRGGSRRCKGPFLKLSHVPLHRRQRADGVHKYGTTEQPAVYQDTTGRRATSSAASLPTAARPVGSLWDPSSCTSLQSGSAIQ